MLKTEDDEEEEDDDDDDDDEGPRSYRTVQNQDNGQRQETPTAT